jgi:hypothetical protein
VAQRSHSRLAVEAVQLFPKGFGVDQAALVRIVHRSLERNRIEFRCQVEERLAG